MGFWGKLGKIALKAAPIAAAFIPGVGPIASMAISGAANAASKKLEGGSWKQALGAGAMGAGTSALGSALGGGFKAPTGGAKVPLSATQKIAKGISAGLGGLSATQNVLASEANKPPQGGGIGPSQQPGNNNMGVPRGGMNFEMPNRNTIRGAQPRRLPFGMGAGQVPDFASIMRNGMNTAIQNQPFRAGQAPFQFKNEDTGMMEDMPGGGLPPIYPQEVPRRAGRRR